MSIGIYAFLRIYFFGFGLSAFAQFRTHSTPSSPRHRSDRPGRSALLPVLRSRSGCAGVGRGALEGYTGSAGGGAGESRHHRKNKKGSKKSPPPPLSISKIPRKKQKDPYKGSVFCAILALQALKGRNLQKCMPYLE